MLIWTADNIVIQSDKKSVHKAKKETLTPSFIHADGNKLNFSVKSSGGDSKYLVVIELVNFDPEEANSAKGMEDLVRVALKGNVKVFCSCPAFKHYGYKYITFKKNAGIEAETRAPDERNPQQIGMGCKHIVSTMLELKDFLGEITKYYVKALRLKN